MEEKKLLYVRQLIILVLFISSAFAANASANLYVFVSKSLKDSVIKAYIKQSKKTGAKLVFKGLINNSFVDTAKYIKELNEEEGAIEIDPNKFKKWNITQVPAIVLSNDCQGRDCKEISDKMLGAVPIRYALTEFAETGDNKGLAQKILGAE